MHSSSTLLSIPSWNILSTSMFSYPELQHEESVSFSAKEIPEAGAALFSSDKDILLGRGTLHAKHPGNKSFYMIVDGFIPQYHAAKTKSDKSDILHGIYMKVLAAGQRFVKHDNDDPFRRTCTVVTEKEAKEKIGHTMRYRQKLQGKKSSPPTPSLASSSVSLPSQAVISRSSSLRSLMTENSSSSSYAVETRPLLPPPKLAKHVVIGLEKHTTTTRNSEASIFSDQELLSVLGTTGEMELGSGNEEIAMPTADDWAFLF